MKPLFLFMLAAFSAAAQTVTPEEAVNYGKSVTLPTWESLSGNGAANGFIGSVSGDTETTQSLWAEGQGKLFTPGRTEADRCRNASDPTCLAVQVVDKTGTNPPTVNPDLTGGLIAGRDEVVNNADKWADLGGNGVGGRRLPTDRPSRGAACGHADVRYPHGIARHRENLYGNSHRNL